MKIIIVSRTNSDIRKIADCGPFAVADFTKFPNDFDRTKIVIGVNPDPTILGVHAGVVSGACLLKEEDGDKLSFWQSSLNSVGQRFLEYQQDMTSGSVGSQSLYPALGKPLPDLAMKIQFQDAGAQSSLHMHPENFEGHLPLNFEGAGRFIVETSDCPLGQEVPPGSMFVTKPSKPHRCRSIGGPTLVAIFMGGWPEHEDARWQGGHVAVNDLKAPLSQ